MADQPPADPPGGVIVGDEFGIIAELSGAGESLSSSEQAEKEIAAATPAVRARARRVGELIAGGYPACVDLTPGRTGSAL